MVTSKRVSNAKSEKYNGNIHKRGRVETKEVRCASVVGWPRLGGACETTCQLQTVSAICLCLEAQSVSADL